MSLLAAVGGADGPGLEPLLPGGGDVGRQVQGADAGMVGFQVFPEPQPEGTGELVEGAVVDAGLALAQVVDEQVADGLAGDVVAADHLLGGERPGELGADHPDRGRGAGREGPGGVQELVEERAVPVVGVGLAGEHGQGAVQQLDAVAGGDVGDEAALGGHDQADPLDRRVERGVPGAGGFPQRLQGGDPGGVADPAHLGGDPGRGGGGQQPGQPGADDVAADQLGQPGAEPAAQFPCPGAVVAGGLQAGQHLVAPVRGPAGLGAAGVPPLLPRRPGVQLEPVEDLQHGQLPPVPDAGPLGDERRGEHPPHHGEPVRGGRRPGRRDRAGREPFHHRQGLGAEPPRRGLRRGGHRGGHQRPFPNSTSRLSGR